MQLTFTHFFRPKWQHPKPGVRRKAIHSLNPEQASDQQILQQLAKQDQDAEVRCSALEKLQNTAMLLDIAQADPTPQVRHDAIRLFCQQICSTETTNLDCQQSLELVVKVKDADILTHIALNAKQLEIQLQAVSLIDIDRALQQVVLSADNFQVRQLAANAITDPEVLDQLIKQCRNKDKGVFKILRDTREQQKQQLRQQEQQRLDCETLCQAIEKLAKEQASDGYQARFNALSQRWQELNKETQQLFLNRFQQALNHCEAQLKQFNDHKQAQLAQQQNNQARSLLINEFKSFRSSLNNLMPAASEVQTELDHFTHAWQKLDTSHPDSDNQLANFTPLEQQIKSLLNSLEQLQQNAIAIEELGTTAADLTQARDLLTAISWPKGFAAPELLQQLSDKIDELKQQKKASDNAKKDLYQQHQSTLDQLEKALDQGKLQQTTPLLRQLNNLITDQPNQLSSSQKQQHQRLNARYQELNNWQLYATQPKLEQLCQEMEALISAQLDAGERSAQLKELQAQWKELDSSTIPRSLRNRFQAANKQAYAPCQAHFEEQKIQRQNNLSQRQLILDKLNTEVAAQEQTPDLKSLSNCSRELKQEWRKYAPVDRAPGKKLQSQFNKLLGQVDQLLADDQQRNADAKTALLEQAKELLDSDELGESLKQAKDLQKQWREIGPANRKQEQNLWKNFRAVCNELFERRDQQQADAKIEAKAEAERSRAARATAEDNDWMHIERRHQLCELLEMQLLTEGQLQIEQQQLDAWNQGSHPKSPFGQQLTQRFELLLELQDNPEAVEQLINESQQQLRLLCIRKEILSAAPTPEEDQILRMEYQMQHLKEALEQHRAPPSAEELKTLEKLWYCLPFNQCHEQLRDRFQQTTG